MPGPPAPSKQSNETSPGGISTGVPAPPPSFTEAAFANVAEEAVILQLHTDHDPPPEVAQWLRAPLLTRCIGPVYDPARNGEFRVVAGPLASSVDEIVHVPRFRAAYLRAAGPYHWRACPVTAAMHSKSRSRCSRFRPWSSAVAATTRSTAPALRCWPRMVSAS